MLRSEFKKLYDDLKIRVEEEGKKDPSWLMGYVQGIGNRQLTGYQIGALIDLLLVHPEVPVPADAPDAAPPGEKNKNLTLAQR